MSLDIGLVVAALRRLITETESAAAAADVELPGRSYITTGGAVYDCEQVTASANSLTTGLAGTSEAQTSIGGCPPGWTAQIEMAIVRCSSEMPSGRRGASAPTVELIERDTLQADKDAAILTDAVEAVAGPDWDQYGQVPASIQFGEVQGGLTAVILSVSLNMWAILPAELP